METVRYMLGLTEEHITTLDITSEYFLYVEPLNEDFVPINGKNYEEDKVRHFRLELNKVDSDWFMTLQYNKIFENVGLDTTTEELKEMVINCIFNEYASKNTD